jgi:hypothetical protein
MLRRLQTRWLCDIAGAHLDRRLRETKCWLDRVVIGERLCPFAPPVRAPPKLRLVGSAATCIDDVVAELAREADALHTAIGTPNAAETTLLVLDKVIGNAPVSWMDLVSLSWRLQEEAIVARGHAEALQIVLFHPCATHSTYADRNAPADAGDYTIRAPHPTIQLLREVDVLRAVTAHPDAEGIPGRNRTRFREMGADQASQRLLACYEDR